MKKFQIKLNGLDCPHCAEKIGSLVSETDGVHNSSVDFETLILTYECDEQTQSETEKNIIALIRSAKPEITPEALDCEEHECECGCCGHHHEHGKHEEHEHHHEHHHEHECECGEEHHHEHHEEAKYMFVIKGIDCPHCAEALAGKIAAIEGIEDVDLDFGEEQSSLSYVCAHEDGGRIAEQMKSIVHEEEPDAEVISNGHEHVHDDRGEHEHHHAHGCECGCGHDHEDKEESSVSITEQTRKYSIIGLDCANCAAALEGKFAKIEGISNVHISFMKSILTFDCGAEDEKRAVQEMIGIAEKDEPDVQIRKIEAKPMKTYRFSITGIDCANCAASLEGKIAAINGIEHCSIDFMKSTLTYECAKNESGVIETKVREIVKKSEPDVVITALTEKKTEKTESEEENDGKIMLYRLIGGAVLFIAGMLFGGSFESFFMIAAYLVLGYDVLLKAVKGIGRGQIFDEHFLMAIATIAAFYLRNFEEAAGVMLFYQIGEYFQEMAVAKSRKSIGELMDIRPDNAVVKRGEDWVSVDPDEVAVGEIVLVKPGERIPLDGIVVKGASSLDTSSLTGESKPREVDLNDEVISGSVNGSGLLEIRTTREYGESTVARILDLVENQESKKSTQENFITKFSRVYTPTVVFAAVAVAITVSLIYSNYHEGIYRACTFLVISCPCALVISIPLSFFAGIGGLSSRGILVKGANLIETLAKTEQIVLDKTGTLTSGVFAVEEVLSSGDMKEKLIEDAAFAEVFSNHPIAEGIKAAFSGDLDQSLVSEVKEIAGRGLSVVYKGEVVLAGNYKLMKDYNVDCIEEKAAGTLVYVARNGKYEGCLVLRDQLKADAKTAIDDLHAAGKKCYIVSGDNSEIANQIGDRLGVDKVYAECLPEDKVNHVKELKTAGTTAFVGDGVNDAPVLAIADIGFAMGALGSDAAIEAADVVIMDDQPSKIALAITSAKRILRVANENIYGAIIVKILTLILGALGIANMWMAIFADTGVAMLCVLNSMRLLHIARKK